MSRRSLSLAALLVLLAACGQSGSAPSAAPAQPSQARQAAAVAGASPTRPGNFNALSRAKAVTGFAKASAAVPRGTPRAPVHLDDRLGVPSFMWAQPGAAAGAVAAARAGAPATPRTPVEAARAHLAGAAAAYGLTAGDTARAAVTGIHDTGRGPVIVSFRQAPGGVEVFRERASVAMARDLSLVAISGALSPAVPASSAVAGGGWSLDAPSALAAALTDLTGEAFAAGDFQAAGRKGKYQLFDLLPAVAAARAERLPQAAGVRQVWFRLPAGLQPAWHVEVAFERLGAETLTYASVISATDGALLFRKDQQQSEAFSYRVWASDVAPYLADDGPQGLNGTPHPTGLLDGYQAPFVARKLVTLQNAPFSRNDPWLPAGSTSSSGNNVVAYADLNAPDGYQDPATNPGSLDLMGTVSSTGVFDYAYVLGAAPAATSDQIQAAITQLFYTNNALHDWFYDVGFDEAAGNSQVNNLGRGGAGGDPLLAEAQDFFGIDNANMTTRADGFSPRMQMFVWSSGDQARTLTINAPAALAGALQSRSASFGPLSFDLTGDIAPAVPALACSALTNPAAVAGKIALVDRGICAFTTKVKAAQNAGAVGVLLRNTATQPLASMGGFDPSITIPSLMVTKADGDAILSALGGGATVNVTLGRIGAPQRDGTIDNLIVAHEWGHYLTNRLVHDVAGLDTAQAQGMGEGWSDFVALLQAVRAGDALAAANAGWTGVFATAGYVAGGFDALFAPSQGFYYGLRRTPYSTDMTKAPLTFKHVSDGVALPVTVPLNLNGAPNSEVHNAGEVWASALWECYAALLRDTGGATPRLTFDEASLRMREYLVASLKLLPPSPTFLEARDALLAAAFAADRADFEAFWAAFAKRGFGVGAVGPERQSTTNTGVVESFALGGELTLVGATFGELTSGCDDRDGTLDDGETGTLSITLRNLGSADLPAGTATLSSTNSHVSFPGGGQVQVGPSLVGGTGVATATVSLAGAGTAELVTLSLTFADGYLAQHTELPVQLRTDVDVLKAASAMDTLEGDNFLWTPAANPVLATGALFERVAGNAVDHAIFGPDVGATSDLTLTSPPLQVGAGTFTVAWEHLFGFEADAAGTPGQAFYDGGVVELSDDGGVTWIDVGGAVGGPAYNGVITATGLGNPLEGRPGFVENSPSRLLNGLLDPVSLDLTSACTGGSACAGKTVRLRFRIGSDAGVAGPVGWYIDNVAFGGLVNTPFDLLTADARRCVNRTPTASAGVDQLVAEGAAVALDASASSDLDAGTTLSYAWAQTAGPAVALLGASTAQPTFTAPSVDADTVLAFVLTVGDGIDSSGASTLVTVRNVNRIPVAVAGPAQAVDERTVATLDGTASSDPDPGAQLTYAWSQTAGPAVTLLGAGSSRPSFLAPEVGADSLLTFRLLVNDGLDSSPAATVDVTVRNVNRPPVASATAAASAAEGTTVALDASASSDLDAGTTLLYLWEQVGGPAVAFSSAAVASPTFTAPPVDANTLVNLRVTVSDGVASSVATVSVLVLDVNATPVARAGPAQSAPERSLVTLDGSGSSDADAGTVLGYTWSQVQDGGPVVSLIGAGSAHPAFTAPDVDPAGVALTFSLVVSDGKGPSTPSTVVVTITDLNRRPVADAGPSIAVAERSSVLLGATGTDPDAGSTLTYDWSQVSGTPVTLGGADTATPAFTAPEVTTATALVFEVTVSDGTLADTSQVTVTVTNQNLPPVAQAGAAQTVNAGTVVSLDAGASSDPDAGAVLAFAWTQTEGPGVALTGAATAAASFTPAAAGTYTFQVTVSDGAALSTATVGVTVLGAQDPGGGGGCGCSAYGSNPAGLLPFLFGLAFLRRRRVR